MCYDTLVDKQSNLGCNPDVDQTSEKQTQGFVSYVAAKQHQQNRDCCQ